jgi:hypothetical protein
MTIGKPNPKHKKRESYAKKPPPSPFILIPIDKMQNVSIENAIQYAMRYTAKNNVEVGFPYDKSCKIIGYMTKGWEFSLPIISTKITEIFGTFHTHTQSMQTTSFGIDDLDSILLLREMRIGCPHLNEMITLKTKSLLLRPDISKKLGDYVKNTRKYAYENAKKIYINSSPINTQYTEFGLWHINEMSKIIRGFLNPILDVRKFSL